MYRQYEDPYKLEEQLNQAKKDYAQAVVENEDEDILISLAERIAELEQRVNFAWQDDEEECD